MPDWNHLPHVPYFVAVLGGSAYQRSTQLLGLTAEMKIVLAQRRRLVQVVITRPMGAGMLCQFDATAHKIPPADLVRTLEVVPRLGIDALAVDTVSTDDDARAFGAALGSLRIAAIAAFNTPGLAKLALRAAGWSLGASGNYEAACRVDGATGESMPLVL